MIKRKNKQKEYEYCYRSVDNMHDLNVVGSQGWILLMDENEKGEHVFYREKIRNKIKFL